MWQVANALLILRYICTFFAVRLSASEFIKFLEPPKNETNDDGLFPFKSIKLIQCLEIIDEETEFNELAEEFVHALVNIVTNVPVK